jgi:zinc and cadmium transporter
MRVLLWILLPLVALPAGSLPGGAFFYMNPTALAAVGDPVLVGILIVSGFIAFLILEQHLHWHHCRRAEAERRKPLT